jgi:hypothetical protein
MVRARAEFFRTGVAECYAAAQSVHDSKIKQAYLELAQGWQALADGIEHLGSQIWRPRIYSGRALPHRSLDDFYEFRPAGPTRRHRKHAVEHPALEHPAFGDRAKAGVAGSATSLPRRKVGRMRADSL